MIFLIVHYLCLQRKKNWKKKNKKGKKTFWSNFPFLLSHEYFHFSKKEFVNTFCESKFKLLSSHFKSCQVFKWKQFFELGISFISVYKKKIIKKTFIFARHLIHDPAFLKKKEKRKRNVEDNKKALSGFPFSKKACFLSSRTLSLFQAKKRTQKERKQKTKWGLATLFL